MKMVYKLSFFCLFLINVSAFSINFMNEEELKKATQEAPVGLCIVNIKLNENTNAKGSGMVYRFQNKIIGITAAHVFDKVSSQETLKATIHFNLSMDGQILKIPTSFIKLSPNYKPFKSIFEERDPAFVKEDIALFSIPYFPQTSLHTLGELNISPNEPATHNHEVEVLAYGPLLANDLKVVRALNISSPQKIKGQIYYDQKDKIFKVDHISNQVLIGINSKNHHIEFSGLKNKPSEIRSLPGDSGSNILEATTRMTLALLTHSDYLSFFQKNSPLASFYSEKVLSQAPSQERTDQFVKDVVKYGKIRDEKIEGDEKKYIFETLEQIDFSTLITPLYHHYNFIQNFIKEAPSPLLKDRNETLHQMALQMALEKAGRG